MELWTRESEVDIMKIQANALLKVQQFFSNFKWSKNCPTLPNPMSEEIMEDLFRAIGAGELSTISLFTFKEHTLAVRDYDEGFTVIEMELFAQEYDDYFKFSLNYSADPVKMSEKEEVLIDFSGIRRYRRICYDFATKSWELKGR